MDCRSETEASRTHWTTNCEKWGNNANKIRPNGERSLCRNVCNLHRHWRARRRTTTTVSYKSSQNVQPNIVIRKNSSLVLFYRKIFECDAILIFCKWLRLCIFLVLFFSLVAIGWIEMLTHDTEIKVIPYLVEVQKKWKTPQQHQLRRRRWWWLQKKNFSQYDISWS